MQANDQMVSQHWFGQPTNLHTSLTGPTQKPDISLVTSIEHGNAIANQHGEDDTFVDASLQLPEMPDLLGGHLMPTPF